MRTTVASSRGLVRWDAALQFDHVMWARSDAVLQAFGHVAKRRVTPADETLPLGSVHFGGAISLRPAGRKLKNRSFVAQAGDLVFSRIDARNGAIGVIPPGSSPLAFSNEFPIYDLAGIGRLIPQFAALVCRTAPFLESIRSVVVGHTGRRRLSHELFERVEIPVPGRDEQEAILHLHEDGMADAEALGVRASSVVLSAVQAIEGRLGLDVPHRRRLDRPFVLSSAKLGERWSVENAFLAFEPPTRVASRFPLRLLGNPDIADVAYGVTKGPGNRSSRYPRPYLRVANVQDGFLDLSEVKTIDVPPERLASYRLQAKDILLCEGNSIELVGRPAMWKGEIEDCVHQNHILRVRTNPATLMPEFLFAYLQSSAARQHFRDRAKRTTNLATISSTDVRELLVPSPPIDEQLVVSALWETAQAEQAALLARANEVASNTWTAVERAIVHGLVAGKTPGPPAV
jgi:type I restriction enzyme S subunit